MTAVTVNVQRSSQAHGAGEQSRSPSSSSCSPNSGPFFRPRDVSAKRGAAAYADYIDELVCHIDRTASGSPKYFATSNHLYSVAALTDSTKAVKERYTHDAYGKRTAYAADGTTVRAKSSYGQQTGFTGRYHDQETGLQYFRARYYSPVQGRFIGRNVFMQRIGPSYSVSTQEPHSLQLVSGVRITVGGGYIDGFSMYLALIGCMQQLDPSGEPGDPPADPPAGTNDWLELVKAAASFVRKWLKDHANEKYITSKIAEFSRNIVDNKNEVPPEEQMRRALDLGIITSIYQNPDDRVHWTWDIQVYKLEDGDTNCVIGIGAQVQGAVISEWYSRNMPEWLGGD